MLSFVLALVLVQSPQTPLAPDAATVASSEAVNSAQAWLLATYPALRRGNLAVHVYGDAETMRFEVVDEPAAQAPGSRAKGAHFAS